MGTQLIPEGNQKEKKKLLVKRKSPLARLRWSTPGRLPSLAFGPQERDVAAKAAPPAAPFSELFLCWAFSLLSPFFSELFLCRAFSLLSLFFSELFLY